MKQRTWRCMGLRAMAMAMFGGGCLFAGPCGITSLQMQDFVTSALIRTGVITVANLVEAATIEQSQDPSTVPTT